MVTARARPPKRTGSTEPGRDPAVRHGVRSDGVQRDSLDRAPVLVVSRSRAEAIPMLQSLLR